MKKLEDGTRKAFSAVRYSGVGIEMAVFIAAGTLGGRWLDSRYGTEPWLLLVGVLLGVVGGFRSLWRTVKQIQKEND